MSLQPLAINNEDVGTTIINMFWEVVDLRDANVDVLISDHPVIRFQGLASRDAAIMIPLDRCALFIATHEDRRFRDIAPTVLAKAANKSTVRATRTYVYGTGPQHKRLVERHFSLAVCRLMITPQAHIPPQSARPLARQRVASRGALRGCSSAGYVHVAVEGSER